MPLTAGWLAVSGSLGTQLSSCHEWLVALLCLDLKARSLASVRHTGWRMLLLAGCLAVSGPVGTHCCLSCCLHTARHGGLVALLPSHREARIAGRPAVSIQPGTDEAACDALQKSMKLVKGLDAACSSDKVQCCRRLDAACSSDKVQCCRGLDEACSSDRPMLPGT